ncbi:hypothetical protein [Peterkaempfera griseoplana]|uniref:hypothetical protein n=1 Tax=Peterkaempfera griseoplana TaxID=66896 RepID=UPI0006E2AD97|nr:hypothetical protein [Peterkaempfera griseoplana]
MNRLHRIFAVGVATAALAFSASPALAASPAVMTPAYSCSIDSLTHVESSVDFLRVHTSPGVGTPAVGEIPGGSAFHFCSGSFQSSGAYVWVYGYGYNGSVKLTGWVATDYLLFP